MRYLGFTKEDEESFLSLSSRGLTAIFLYTNRVVHNGEVFTISDDKSEKIIAFSGEPYAPISFFTKFLGATADDNGGAKSLVIGDVAVVIDGMLKGGCLPVERLCKSFGIKSVLLYDNSFLVMGNEQALSELCESEVLIKAGPYALFGDYDTSAFTDEDYEAAAKNFHDKLVGTKESNDLSNPIIRAKIDDINLKCKEALDTLNYSDDPPILWGEKLLCDTEDGANQYSHVRRIAAGYATYGSDYYKNEEVFEKIKFCLEWMYRHAYGDDMIEGRGWRDPNLPNWWYMYIGAPEKLADILLMLYEEISLEDRRRYLKCFEWIASWMCLGPKWRMTRIKICTEYGVLLHKPSYLIQEAEDFAATLRLAREDYMDFSHSYPHNMSYGGLYYSRFVYVASALAGTALEYNSPNSYKQFLRLKYMYEPAMYKGQAFYMLAGRHTKEMVESTKATEFLVYLLSMIGVWGKDEDDYIKSFLKKHSVNPIFKDSMLKKASFVELDKYVEILNDEGISSEYNYEYAYTWYTGDRAVQHGKNYAFGIAMASKRHINYESILKENQVGWYSGDGTFHIYTDYDSNQYDGDNFINNINIAYRFPGATEDMQERAVRGIFYDAWKSPNSFAGSIQTDNKFVVAGMEFISEFCDGANEDVYDEVRGHGRAKHDNDLVAKKSWFCFDKEAVLLGAGITSTMNSPVNTTVAHRRIVNDGEYSQSVKCCAETEILPKAEFEKRYTNPEYVRWGGHVGYVFLDKTNLYVSRYNYTTSKEQPYLEIRAEHGENPTGAKYAYAVLPYADDQTLSDYAKAPEVEIISNTENVQAVRKASIGVTGIVFYEGGELSGVAADCGALVILKEADGCLELSVCDPTQEASEINIKVSGKLRTLSADSTASVTECEDFALIKLSCENSRGRPHRVVFEKI